MLALAKAKDIFDSNNCQCLIVENKAKKLEMVWRRAGLEKVGQEGYNFQLFQWNYGSLGYLYGRST